MKLESQVVSLELAKKMYWLGFDKESAWWWNGTKWGIGGQIVGLEPMKWILSKRIKGSAIENIPAYTVAELGEMLPINCASWRSDKTLYSCQRFDFGGCCGQEITADTEADCRARLLIWLKENNYL